MNCPTCNWDMSSWRNTYSGAHFWECGACLRAGKISRVPIEDKTEADWAPATRVKLNLDGPTVKVAGSTVTEVRYDNDHLRWQAIPGMGWVAVPSSTATICARCSTPLDVTDATADAVVREHEAECFVVGDAVRWWPSGMPDDPTSPSVTGLATSTGRHPMVRVETTSGYWPTTHHRGYTFDRTPLAGSIMDTSASPGTIRRIPRPEQEAKPKWRQFKVDWSAMNEASTPKDWRREYLGEWAAPDDRADAMEYGRRAIAEQHAKRVEYLATAMRPSLTEHLKRAVVDGKAGPSMVGELPARPVRPDGFEQSRIDMLKAAMLAPSVKVKR